MQSQIAIHSNGSGFLTEIDWQQYLKIVPSVESKKSLGWQVKTSLFHTHTTVADLNLIHPLFGEPLCGSPVITLPENYQNDKV